jgi:hypothetical protein
MRKWTSKAFRRVEKDVAAGVSRGAIMNRLRVFHRLSVTKWDSVRSAFKRAGKSVPVAYTVSGSDTSVKIPAGLMKKVLRRARRHFSGKTVTHRVVSSSTKSITFRFNRDRVKYRGVPRSFEVTVSR